MSNPTALLGTWRLLSYEVWNESGEIVAPLGPDPEGYAAFDASGRAFIQLARSNASGSPSDERSSSYMGYFGTVTVNASATEFTVAVEASNMPHYIGTRQERRFRIDGDSLVLGIEGQYRAVLRRCG